MFYRWMLLDKVKNQLLSLAVETLPDAASELSSVFCSHDSRTPIRSNQSFASVLCDKYDTIGQPSLSPDRVVRKEND